MTGGGLVPGSVAVSRGMVGRTNPAFQPDSDPHQPAAVETERSCLVKHLHFTLSEKKVDREKAKLGFADAGSTT